MKLKTRVWIIIAASLLGLVVMAVFGLYGMRQSMLEERKSQITQFLDFSDAQLQYFHGLELSGKLTKEEAQAQAKAAIAAQRKGDNYFFVRALSNNVMLVHPIADRIDKVDNGGKMADGRFLADVYKDELAKNKGGHPLVWVAALKPGKQDKVMYPKLTGVSEFEPWGWITGIGFFVDDIDARFWKQAMFFIIMGSVVLILLAGLILRMRGTILRQLGGEPQDAADYMKKIANGDLGVEIVLGKNDSDSLMASLKVMQMKLKNITYAIQENATTLDSQIQSFDSAAKSYAETKSEEELSNLLRTIKKVGKTADILGKSVSRFKS